MSQSPALPSGLSSNAAPVPVALVTAIAGAVAIELIRARGETSGELALAILFYGGIGGGVVLVSQAPSGSRNLNQYLFGSIATTTSAHDLLIFALLAALVARDRGRLRSGVVLGEQRRGVRRAPVGCRCCGSTCCWRCSPR